MNNHGLGVLTNILQGQMMSLIKNIFLVLALLMSTSSFASSKSQNSVLEAIDDFCPKCDGLVERYRQKTNAVCNGSPNIVSVLTSDGGSILLGLKATNHPYFQAVDTFSNTAFNCDLNVWSKYIEKYVEKISVGGTSTTIY